MTKVCAGVFEIAGDRLSVLFQEESCGFRRPLQHRDGRTLFYVHHMFIACALCSNCFDQFAENVFFVTG